MAVMTGTRVSIFPLPGAVLYPGLQLPLHIFEPRYRALVKDALARDSRIGMIQPQRAGDETRFRMLRELDVVTPFRQIEAELLPDLDEAVLAPVERASFEREARRFADAQGYAVDWDSVARLDDLSLINGVSQIAPFDMAAKQALLEANSLGERCELLVQLMQFFGRRDSDDDRVTLQ
jgi:Lon protease-like protein